MAHISRYLLAIGLIVFACFAAVRAQNIQPFVDCIERERDNSGALTGKYVAHFGYINYGTTAVFIPLNSAGNFLTPGRNPPNQPSTFMPGVHPRILSVTLDASVATETWRLSTYLVTATLPTDPVTSSQLCGSDNQNARLITYQGRLSDGSAAANGVYDLQFQLFSAATGGTARTTPITLEDVTVTNGIFTVPLNLGVNASINPTGRIQALNAAILSGEDNFFEIGVRPGNSTGAFTILTPRQPLTAVPLAMLADTANNAVRAAFADNATTAGNSLQLGGTAANQFIKTDDSRLSCQSGFTAIAGGRLCVSAMQPAAAFYGANGATQTCINMGARVGTVADATLSLSQSGFNYFSVNVGWLGDYAGDNLRPTWNPPVNGDLDGSAVNVYTGGSGGTAPTFPYRCVY